MKILILCRLALVFAVLTLTVLLSGCVATVGEYGYYDGGDIGVDYYESYGVDYGGWGPSYYVAPFRDGDHHRRDEFRRGDEHRQPSESGHAARTYRSAPASHSMPSIPSRPRSGGSRSHSSPTRR